MARIKRIVAPGYPHHITQRGVRSMEIFFEDADRKEYLKLLRQYGRQFGVQFISYCLMDNHVHLIGIPEKPDSLARAVGEAHRRYTRMINFRANVRGYLFQGRFFSCPICTGDYLFAALRYVECNPVRAKIVQRAWDYPWSSAAFHSGVVGNDPLVTKSHLLSEITDWKQFLYTRPEFTEQLREKSRTGRPFGSDSFFSTIEKITGRDVRPKSPGRPRNK